MAQTLCDILADCNRPQLQFLQYLQDLGLLNKRYACPKCGAEMVLTSKKHTDGYLWKCRRKTKDDTHAVSRTVRRGSFFAGSHMTLQNIYILCYMWIHGFHQQHVMHELKIGSHNTIVDWYNYCRESCEAIVIRNSEVIGGSGKNVELYRSKLGKTKYSDREISEDQWAFGGVEKNSNKYFMVIVPDGSAENISEVVKDNIFPGSTIQSNCWEESDFIDTKEYVDLQNEYSLIYIESDNECEATSDEGTSKRKLPSTNKNKEQFSTHLAEFIYRKCLENCPDPFRKFLADIVTVFIPKECDDDQMYDCNTSDHYQNTGST